MHYYKTRNSTYIVDVPQGRFKRKGDTNWKPFHQILFSGEGHPLVILHGGETMRTSPVKRHFTTDMTFPRVSK